MTAVCNATPLINFATINRIDILQAIFRQIVIPLAVFNETTGSGFPGTPFVLEAIEKGWLAIRPVNTIASAIPVELDDGEREAISLALSIDVERILLDEREARLVAHQLGLQVVGTLGILLLAKNQQIIQQVRPLLDAMIDLAQYWVSATLYEQVLKQAGENVE